MIWFLFGVLVGWVVTGGVSTFAAQRLGKRMYERGVQDAAAQIAGW